MKQQALETGPASTRCQLPVQWSLVEKESGQNLLPKGSQGPLHEWACVKATVLPELQAVRASEPWALTRTRHTQNGVISWLRCAQILYRSQRGGASSCCLKWHSLLGCLNSLGWRGPVQQGCAGCVGFPFSVLHAQQAWCQRLR